MDVILVFVWFIYFIFLDDANIYVVIIRFFTVFSCLLCIFSWKRWSYNFNEHVEIIFPCNNVHVYLHLHNGHKFKSNENRLL